VLTLYRGQGSAGERRQWVVTTGVNGLMPLMTGEEVKWGLNRGFKVVVRGGGLRLGYDISVLKDGRWKWPGAAGFGGGTAEHGWGEKGAGMWGPHVSGMCKPERKAPFGPAG
jgi:hypothetical protein